MEAKGHKAHVDLSSGVMFADQSKSVAILNGNHFDENNRRLYTSLRVAVNICEHSYCDKHEKKKYGRAAWN